MKLKEELEQEYDVWQDIIDNEQANLDSWYEIHEIAKTNYENLDNKIENASSKLLRDKNLPEKSFSSIYEELTQFKVELNEKFDNFSEKFFQQVIDLTTAEMDVNVPDGEEEQQQGLTPQKILQFEQFQADESHVGDQCAICMGDIEAGRNMMRLNCDGQHTFCQVCIEGWFAKHTTCPICRHAFA